MRNLLALSVSCAICWCACAVDSRLVGVRDGSDPGLVIATFEDGTAMPDDRRFQPFQFYAYNASAGSVVTSTVIAPGHNSNFALGLNWIVTDEPNGKPDYPGVGVRTLVNGIIDLTGYSRLVFAMKYAPSPVGLPASGAGCQPVSVLTVAIECNEHNTSFENSMLMSADWTMATAAFADFREPSYLAATGTTIEDCLKVVNGIHFNPHVVLADDDCAAGNLSLDDISVRPPLAADGGADAGPPSTGISLVPDANGRFDGSNAAAVVGQWNVWGDDYDATGTPGAGTCPTAGFPVQDCSVITTPVPGQPFRPDANGKGMCTTGIAAQVIPGSDGLLAYSKIWGNTIGFDLGVGPYDAPAHGITGLAFDISAAPAGGHMRVEFPTTGTEMYTAYWRGATDDTSPITAPGHYEMRWPEIGGPFYLGTAAPPFDPTKLESIHFSVVSNMAEAVAYSFCINNVTLLTN